MGLQVLILIVFLRLQKHIKMETLIKTDNEKLLAEAVAILSGEPLPCTYSYEEMESSLHEAEADYQKGNTESHETICKRYGV